MAGYSMDFTTHPGYQRMMQRMGRVRPEQRAIWKTLSVDPQFADAETRKLLASLASQRDVAHAGRSLDLKERGMTSDMGLRRQAFGEKVRQRRISTGIGLGQVAAEAKFGMDRDAIDLATLKEKKEFTNLLRQRYGR